MKLRYLPLIAVAPLFAHCANPTLDDDGWFSCSDKQPQCPPGQICSGGRCVEVGATVDQGLPETTPLDDAQIEGPLPDAPVSDGPLTDAPLPDAPLPDAPLTDAPLPDGPLPDSPIPDTAPPDSKPPDSTSPDLLGADAGGGALTALEPGGLPIRAVAGGQVHPDVAYGAYSTTAAYLVVWADEYGNIGHRLIQPDGTMKTAASVATGGPKKLDPAVAYVHPYFLVVWSELTTIRGRRVNTVGTLVGLPFDISKGAATAYKQFPAVASTGNEALVTWVDTRHNPTSGTEIYGALVKSDGTLKLSTDFAITSSTPGGQDHVTAAALGSNYLVMWGDEGATPWHLDGKTVSGAGTVGGATLTISGPGSTQNRFPSLASDGTNYLAVWTRGWSEVVAARINASGALLSTTPKVISAGNLMHPDVAFNGTHYLVTAMGNNGSPPINNNIYSARLTKAGVLLDPLPVFASKAAAAQEFPAVGGGAGSWLVVWHDKRNFSGNKDDIFGTRMK